MWWGGVRSAVGLSGVLRGSVPQADGGDGVPVPAAFGAVLDDETERVDGLHRGRRRQPTRGDRQAQRAVRNRYGVTVAVTSAVTLASSPG